MLGVYHRNLVQQAPRRGEVSLERQGMSTTAWHLAAAEMIAGRSAVTRRGLQLNHDLVEHLGDLVALGHDKGLADLIFT